MRSQYLRHICGGGAPCRRRESVEGMPEYLMKGTCIIILVYIKTTSPNTWGVGGKSTLFWLLWRREKGRVLARRPALILARLFFFWKVPLYVCSCDRKIKRPLQRCLSFKQPFPKITKVEEGKENRLWMEAWAKEKNIKWGYGGVSLAWESTGSHPSHLTEEETEAQESLFLKE